MADEAAINRAKGLGTLQADGRITVSKSGIDSSGDTKSVLKDGEKISTEALPADKTCNPSMKVITKAGNTGKVSLSLGFLRQTQSQLLKIKTAPASRSRCGGDSVTSFRKSTTCDNKDMHSSNISQKGIHKSKTATVSGQCSEINLTRNDQRTDKIHSMSPILRKVSRKENICSDSPANIQSPRSRKKVKNLGQLSFGEVLSPLTSPTQSENDTNSPTYSQKELISQNSDITSDIHETKDASFRKLELNVSHSKCPSPTSCISTVPPHIEGHHDNISTDPNSGETSQVYIHKTSFIQESRIKPTTSTAPSIKLNPSSPAATNLPLDSQSSIIPPSTSSSHTKLTPTTTDKLSNLYRIAHNRSPSFLPIAKRCNEKHSNAKSVRQFSTKMDTFSQVKCPGNKHSSNKHQEGVVESNVVVKTVNKTIDKDNKCPLRSQGCQIKQKKTPESKNVAMKEHIHGCVTSVQENKPKMIGDPIDIVDHVMSGEKTLLTIPFHGKSSNQYNSSCMRNESCAVSKGEYSCQEFIDSSKISFEIDDDELNAGPSDTKELSKTVLDNEIFGNVVHEQDIAGRADLELCTEGETKCQSVPVSKSADLSSKEKSQKKLKETENIRTKKLSPNVLRKQNGKSSIARDAKINLRIDNSDVLEKCVQEGKRHIETHEEGTGPSSRLTQLRQSKYASRDVVKTKQVLSAVKCVSGKTVQTQLPERTELEQKTINYSKYRNEVVTSKVPDVSRITRKLPCSQSLPKQIICLLPSATQVKSMTSTRESSVDSRFDDDAVSVTSDISSLTSSSLLSLYQSRSTRGIGKDFKTIISNKGSNPNIVTKLKQVSVHKSDQITSRLNVTNSASKRFIPRRPLSATTKVRNSINYESNNKTGIGMSEKVGNKLSLKNLQTKNNDIPGLREITRIKTSDVGKEAVTEKGERDSVERIQNERLHEIVSGDNENMQKTSKKCQTISDNNLNSRLKEVIETKQIIENNSDINLTDKNQVEIVGIPLTDDKIGVGTDKGNVMEIEQELISGINDYVTANNHFDENVRVNKSEHKNRTVELNKGEQCLQSDCVYAHLSTTCESRSGIAREVRSVSPISDTELVGLKNLCFSALSRDEIPPLAREQIRNYPAVLTKQMGIQTQGEWGSEGSNLNDSYQNTFTDSETASGLSSTDMCGERGASKCTQREGFGEDDEEGGEEGKRGSKLPHVLAKLSLSRASSGEDKCKRLVCSKGTVIKTKQNEHCNCDLKVSSELSHGISVQSQSVKCSCELHHGILADNCIHDISSHISSHVVSSHSQSVTFPSDNSNEVSLNKQTSAIPSSVARPADTKPSQYFSFSATPQENDRLSGVVESLGRISDHHTDILSDIQTTDVMKLVPSGALQKRDIDSTQQQDVKSLNTLFQFIGDRQAVSDGTGSRCENSYSHIPGDPHMNDSVSVICDELEINYDSFQKDNGSMRNCIDMARETIFLHGAYLNNKGCRFTPEKGDLASNTVTEDTFLEDGSMIRRLVETDDVRSRYVHTVDDSALIDENDGCPAIVDENNGCPGVDENNGCPGVDGNNGCPGVDGNEECSASVFEAEKSGKNYFKEDILDSEYDQIHHEIDDTDSDEVDDCFSAETDTFSNGGSLYDALYIDKSLSGSSYDKQVDTVSYGTPPNSSSEVREGGKEETADDVDVEMLTECSIESISRKHRPETNAEQSLYKSAMESLLDVRSGYEDDSKCEDITDDYDVSVDIVDDSEDVRINDVDCVDTDSDDAESLASSESSFQSATSDILMAAVSASSRELVLFEGCGTSKAGEGMARLIDFDSENMEVLYIDDQNDRSNENSTPQKTYFGNENYLANTTNQKIMMFASTPKICRHKQRYTKSYISPAVVSSTCSSNLKTSSSSGDTLTSHRGLDITPLSSTSPSERDIVPTVLKSNNEKQRVEVSFTNSFSLSDNQKQCEERRDHSLHKTRIPRGKISSIPESSRQFSKTSGLRHAPYSKQHTLASAHDNSRATTNQDTILDKSPKLNLTSNVSTTSDTLRNTLPLPSPSLSAVASTSSSQTTVETFRLDCTNENKADYHHLISSCSVEGRKTQKIPTFDTDRIRSASSSGTSCGVSLLQQQSLDKLEQEHCEDADIQNMFLVPSSCFSTERNDQVQDTCSSQEISRVSKSCNAMCTPTDYTVNPASTDNDWQINEACRLRHSKQEIAVRSSEHLICRLSQSPDTLQPDDSDCQSQDDSEGASRSTHFETKNTQHSLNSSYGESLDYASSSVVPEDISVIDKSQTNKSSESASKLDSKIYVKSTTKFKTEQDHSDLDFSSEQEAIGTSMEHSLYNSVNTAGAKPVLEPAVPSHEKDVSSNLYNTTSLNGTRHAISCHETCPRQVSFVKHKLGTEPLPSLMPGKDYQSITDGISDSDNIDCDSCIDNTDLFQCKSKESILYSTETKPQIQDRTSLFESGYSSYIKSPDVRSPVLEIENDVRNYGQIISSNIDLNLDSTSINVVSIGSATLNLLSDQKSQVPNKTGPKVNHLINRDTGKTQIIELSSMNSANQECLETRNDVTTHCEKSSLCESEQVRTLTQKVWERDENKNRAIKHVGYSENMPRHLSAHICDDLETTDKSGTDVNKLNKTEDQHSGNRLCLNLDTPSYDSQHVCQSKAIEIKNTCREMDVFHNEILLKSVPLDSFQNVNFQQKDNDYSVCEFKSHLNYGIYSDGIYEDTVQFSQPSDMKATQSFSDISQVSAYSENKLRNVGRVATKAVIMYIDDNHGYSSDVYENSKSGCCLTHPGQECACSKNLLNQPGQEHACAYSRNLLNRKFPKTHNEHELCIERPKLKYSRSCSDIPECITAGSSLSAHSENSCSRLGLYPSTDARHDRSCANKRWHLLVANQVKDATPSEFYDMEYNCNSKQSDVQVKRYLNISPLNFYEEMSLVDKGNVIQKQEMLRDCGNIGTGDHDCYAAKNMFKNSAKVEHNFSNVSEHSCMCDKQKYSSAHHVQDKCSNNETEYGDFSEDVDHIYKSMSEVRSNSSSPSITSSSSSPPMSRVNHRTEDSSLDITKNCCDNMVVSEQLSTRDFSCPHHHHLEYVSECESCLTQDQPRCKDCATGDQPRCKGCVKPCSHSVDFGASIDSSVPSDRAHECQVNVDILEEAGRKRASPVDGSYVDKQLKIDTPDVNVDLSLTTSTSPDPSENNELSMDIATNNDTLKTALNKSAVLDTSAVLNTSEVLNMSEVLHTLDVSHSDSSHTPKSARTIDVHNELHIPRKLSTSPHSEGPPREKSPFILEIVCELLSKVSASENKVYHRAKPSLSHNEPDRLVVSDVKTLTPEEKARANGVRVINKWKLMVKRNRVVAIRESLKVKLAGTDENRSSLPPPISPTPPRKYKWHRGESGIWKKIYLDDNCKDENCKDDSSKNVSCNEDNCKDDSCKNASCKEDNCKGDSCKDTSCNDERQERVDCEHTSNHEDLSCHLKSLHALMPCIMQSDDHNMHRMIVDKSKCMVETDISSRGEVKYSEHSAIKRDENDMPGDNSCTDSSQTCSIISCDAGPADEEQNIQNDMKTNLVEASDKLSIEDKSSKQIKDCVTVAEEIVRDGIHASNLLEEMSSENIEFQRSLYLGRNGANKRDLDSQTKTAWSAKSACVRNSRHIDPRSRQIDGDIKNAICDKTTNSAFESVKQCGVNSTNDGYLSELVQHSKMLSAHFEDTQFLDLNGLQLSSNNNDVQYTENVSSVSNNVTNCRNDQEHIQHTHYEKMLREEHAKMLQDEHGKMLQEEHGKMLQEEHGKMLQEEHGKMLQEELGKYSEEESYLLKIVNSNGDCTDSELQELQTTSSRITTNSESCPETVETLCTMKSTTPVRFSNQLCAVLENKQTDDEEVERTSKLDESRENFMSTKVEICENKISNKLLVFPCEGSDILPSTEISDVCTNTRNIAVTKNKANVLDANTLLEVTEIQSTNNTNISEKDLVDKEVIHSPRKPLTSSDQNKGDKTYNADARQEQSGISPNEQVINQDRHLSLTPNSYIAGKHELDSCQSERSSANSQVDDIELEVSDKNVGQREIISNLPENMAHDNRRKGSNECQVTEADSGKTKIYAWPTVAESLKRFQKSIAGNPLREQLQKGREQQCSKSVTSDKLVSRKICLTNCDNREKQAIDKEVRFLFKEVTETARSSAVTNNIRRNINNEQTVIDRGQDIISQADAKTETKSPATVFTGNLTGHRFKKMQSSFVRTSQSDVSSSKVASIHVLNACESVRLPVQSAQSETLESLKCQDKSIDIHQENLGSVSTVPKDIKSNWLPNSAQEISLRPSPIVSLSRESIPASRRWCRLLETHSRECGGLPSSVIETVNNPSETELSSLSRESNNQCLISLRAEIIQDTPKVLPILAQQQHNDHSLLSSWKDHQENQLYGLTSETATDSTEDTHCCTNSSPSPAVVPQEEVTEITEIAESVEQTTVFSPRTGTQRHVPSAKLISVSVWDTHDGDKTLRLSRRLWAQEEVPSNCKANAKQ